MFDYIVMGVVGLFMGLMSRRRFAAVMPMLEYWGYLYCGLFTAFTTAKYASMSAQGTLPFIIEAPWWGLAFTTWLAVLVGWLVRCAIGNRLDEKVLPRRPADR